MSSVIICVLAFVGLIELSALIVLLIRLKKAEDKLKLSRKACFFLCEYTGKEKEQQLEQIEDIFEQIACDGTQITTDLAVVRRAEEMLKEDLNEKKKQSNTSL